MRIASGILTAVLFVVHFPMQVNSQEPVFTLKKYLQFKSYSGHEKPAGVYLKNLCEEMGIYTRVFSDSDSTYNFCASILPLDSKKKSVVLLNHIDVVSVENETNLQYPPFDSVIKNDTIYGRGTLDMKSLAIMQLFALKKMKDSFPSDSLKHNIVLLCLSGEETGGKNGAGLIIQPDILSQINPLVVFGEGGGGLSNVVPGKPNELCFFVSNAEKKSLWIKLDAKIKSHGHGSVASSKTAHKLLLKAINKIENTEERILIDKSTKQTFRELGMIMGGYKGFIIKHFDWWIFKPLRKKIIRTNESLKVLVSNSYQLTQMESPKGPINQVAQSASAYYDCRLLPNRSEKPFFMKLLFRILDPRIKISIEDESPTSEPTKLDYHYDNVKNAIIKSFPEANVIPILFPATTDNSYFRNVGVPCYGLLPFQLSQSMLESVHSDNEKIPTNSINVGIKIYCDLLKNYLIR